MSNDRPKVIDVEALAIDRVRVTFSKEMTDNVDLVDPTKYRFDGGVFATSVVRVAPDAVEVVTSGQDAGATYELTVLP
jgi:hypothetical protein